MSTPIAQYKLPSRIEIGFDSETKASIADLKAKLDEAAKGLIAKDSNGVDGLLKTMQAEAANDSNGIAPQRETINDVDYLSESVPYIDEYDWASESVPQITKADMQLIFIKNLSECLIQRMHSMDRFSADDSAIVGINMEPWDLIVGKRNGRDCFAVVIATLLAEDIDCSKVDVILLDQQLSNDRVGAYTNIYFNKDNTYRTITEAELRVCRAAMEACYA